MDPPDNNVFNDSSDICEQLYQRYSKSSAPQHTHLCAIAAATRSLLQSESLPLTPFSYFAATISTLSSNLDNDPQALSSLSSFLSIVLPLVPTIPSDKAVEAIGVLVNLLESDGLGTATVRSLVKCLGILVGFCDKEDWDSVEVGFETLVKFSIDKRPKVRKCAQDCILTVVKSFDSSSVTKKAGKRIHSLIKDNMTLAIKLSAPKEIGGSKDEHQEVLHSLNILKPVIPYLSVKDNGKVLAQLLELMSCESSTFTRHIFDNITAILDASSVEMILPKADNILKTLTSYMEDGENTADNVLLAATLAKRIIDKLHDGGISIWITYFPLVVDSISGLLAYADLEASNILKELINTHIDGKKFLTGKKQAVDEEALSSSEFAAVKAICLVFENLLISSSRFPNKYILATLSVLFLKLGGILDLCAKGIILKLADWMTIASGGTDDTKNLQECIGSAVIAAGPEKLVALLPISLNAKDYSTSNTWLIPILNKYVCGSSLGFFMKHVVPLAVSFQEASSKVKKSVIREELQAFGRGCWGLLPAFCRCPSDVHKNAQALTTLLIPFLKEDSFMLENISAALQELVTNNKNVLASDKFSGEPESHQKEGKNLDLALEFKRKCSYSKKSASKNIKALASCSEEWLQALINVFFESSPASYQQLKEAIECLTSISDSSITQRIFTSSMERSGITNDSGKYGKLGSHSDGSIDNGENSATLLGEVAKRCVILKLGSCFVEGANEDLVKILFDIAKDVLEATHGAGHHEAYYTLSRLLEKHSWFRASHVEQLMNLLPSVKPPTDTESLKSRFSCYTTLLIDAVQGNLDEENTQAFLILNEIILALKASTEEGRKTAYDALIGACSSLRDSSSAKSNESYKKFIDMILAYLSGSSPHIKSGAVSALSVLVYSDADICLSVPDLVPSILTLLQSKDVEVTKAVLGFVKVLVSTVEAKDLHNLLSDIVNGVLLWSSVSRHHFKSKVTVIMEILMRKCGVAAVKSVAAEKYKFFLKTVAENRHGKTSSREAGSTETESTTPDSRQQKRKDRESSDSLKEKDSRGPYKRKKRWEEEKDTSTNSAKEGVMGGRKRKREMTRKNNIADEPSGNGAGRKPFKRKGESSHHKQERGRAPLQKRDMGGKLKRGFPGKGKMERQKRTADNVRGSDASFASSKRERFQNRRQKANTKS